MQIGRGRAGKLDGAIAIAVTPFFAHQRKHQRQGRQLRMILIGLIFGGWRTHCRRTEDRSHCGA